MILIWLCSLQGGVSALMNASFKSNLECVKLLLDAKASPDVQSKVIFLFVSSLKQQ